MDTKKCGCCGETLPVENFSLKNKATGLRQSKCKPCVRSYGKQHYQSNKDEYLDKAARNSMVARERAGDYARLSLVGKTCTECGAAENLTYYQGVGAQGQPVHMTVHAGLSLERVQQAIDRSTVLCGKCRQNGFYAGIALWSHLTQPQREAQQRARTEPPLIVQDPGRYKNYRRVPRQQASAEKPSA